MAIAARRRVLHLHPHRADVLVERIDGEPPAFTLVCPRHAWASPSVDRMCDVGICPACLAESDAAPGRARYAALHDANVHIEGWR